MSNSDAGSIGVNRGISYADLCSVSRENLLKKIIYIYKYTAMQIPSFPSFWRIKPYVSSLFPYVSICRKNAERPVANLQGDERRIQSKGWLETCFQYIYLVYLDFDLHSLDKKECASDRSVSSFNSSSDQICPSQHQDTGLAKVMACIELLKVQSVSVNCCHPNCDC